MILNSKSISAKYYFVTTMKLKGSLTYVEYYQVVYEKRKVTCG